MTESHRNWVRPQFDSLIQVAFCTLHKRVCKDTKEANGALEDSGIDLNYSVTGIDKSGRFPCFTAKRVIGRGEDRGKVLRSVEFAAQGQEIYVYGDPEGRRLFSITSQWNEEKMQCDWMIEGEALELWQVSRRALRDLIFLDVG